MPIEWYVRLGNVERGPVSSEMLKQLALQGKIRPEMLVRKGQSGNWLPASRWKGLLPVPVTERAPAAVPPPGPASRPGPAPRGGPADARAREGADGSG